MAIDSDPRDIVGDENSDEAIVREAHRRWERCQKYESQARSWWRDEYKFANGDPYNNWQWPSAYYNARNSRNQPTLTINKARQLNLHIINDAKQKKSGIKFRPLGDGATAEAAKIWDGIARHVQNQSKAQSQVYGKAISFQVQAGLGFSRVLTRYQSENTFDQEVYFVGIDDPLSVYLDPDCSELDGNDARFGFVFVDRPRDEVETKYPELKGRLSVSNAVDGHDASWMRDDLIREAEYYRVVEESDELLGTNDGTTILRSEAPSDLIKAWEAEAEAKGEKVRRRKVVRKHLMWYKIIGDQIVDRERQVGRSVPIVPWIGEQTVVDGVLDRKGHTRALISAQQMLNYNRSASVEFGALQSKTPWIVAMKAVEGFETYWSTANTVNHAYLAYNHVDDDGRDIPPPTRLQPPTAAPVFLEGAMSADKDMQLASGQYEAELGAPGNERSGRAINERQRQSDRATYHFTDNQGAALVRHGYLLLEIVPGIYDTEQVIRIIGEDGTDKHVKVDPLSPVAHQAVNDPSSPFSHIFNPNIGRYEVTPDVGPDYATERQEAFDAIVQILTQAPALIDRIGDLLFRVADFPLADEIAERLKPGLPPAAQKAISELQVQLGKQNKLLAEAMQALTEERLKAKAKDSYSAVDEFKADTDRTKMLLDAATKVDPAMAAAMIQQMAREAVRQALQDNLGPVRGASDASLGVTGAPAQEAPATPAVPPSQGLTPAPSVAQTGL